MRSTQECGHCHQAIPLRAWVCPHCGGWVAEITRFAAPPAAEAPVSV